MNTEDIIPPVQNKLAGWLDSLVVMLPNIVAAFVVLFLFWIGARIMKRLLETVFGRVTRNSQVVSLLSKLAYIAVIVGGVMVALDVLQLEKTVTSLLAGVGILGLALGFAFQDLAANLMAGVLIATSEPLSNGDLIRTGEFFGTIESVSMRFSTIRTFDGQLVRIPNKQIFEPPLVNYTQSGERRVDLAVGVSYGDDLEKAHDVAVEAVEQVKNRDKNRPVELFYTGFGNSSIDFSIRFWIDHPVLNYLQARSEAIVLIQKGLSEERHHYSISDSNSGLWHRGRRETLRCSSDQSSDSRLAIVR